MPAPLLEVCVDDALGLAEAVAGGADRIELCAALSLGGLTPSPGLMHHAASSHVPVLALIRPRAGDFVFTAAAVDVMHHDIAAARAAGLAGVVLGASLPDGRLNEAVLAALLAGADGLDVTLHRAIDLAPDPVQAVAAAIRLGFRRVLSSGGAPSAVHGIGRLATMMQTAAGRLSVMPGSGISALTWPKLAALGVTEVHASCAERVATAPGALELGFANGQEKRTNRANVAALKAALLLNGSP